MAKDIIVPLEKNVVRYVEKYKPFIFSAGRQEEFQPIVSTNPYNDFDYSYFEQAWAYAGKSLDILMDYTFAKGIKPTLELIDNKNKKQEQVAKELEPYQHIIDEMIKIDTKPSIKFNDKLKSGRKMSKVFGRGMIAADPDMQRVPKALKIIHPRDLGRVYPRKMDWSVSSVDVNLSSTVKDNYKDEDMIYIVNDPDNPIRRNIGYGFSDFHRIVGASRSLQRFVEADSPEIVETMWANYGIVVLRPQSNSPQSDLTEIVGGLQPGQWNVVSANPEDVVIHQPSLDPKVEKLIELMKFFQQMIIGNFQVPASLLGKEEEQTFATLLGRLRAFLAGAVAQERMFCASLAETKWYNRILALQFPEAVGKVRIKAEFEPIIIESWIDNVEAMERLDKVVPKMPLAMKLDLLNLGKYQDEIEKEMKEASPAFPQPDPTKQEPFKKEKINPEETETSS